MQERIKLSHLNYQQMNQKKLLKNLKVLYLKMVLQMNEMNQMYFQNSKNLIYVMKKTQRDHHSRRENIKEHKHLENSGKKRKMMLQLLLQLQMEQLVGDQSVIYFMMNMLSLYVRQEQSVHTGTIQYFLNYKVNQPQETEE